MKQIKQSQATIGGLRAWFVRFSSQSPGIAIAPGKPIPIFRRKSRFCLWTFSSFRFSRSVIPYSLSPIPIIPCRQSLHCPTSFAEIPFPLHFRRAPPPRKLTPACRRTNRHENTSADPPQRILSETRFPFIFLPFPTPLPSVPEILAPPLHLKPEGK